MQGKKTFVAVAVVSLFAAAASALAYGPGPGGGMGIGFGPGSGAQFDPALQAERMQARLDELKGALKLQPAQMDAWNAYEAKVRTDAQARAQLHRSMFENRGDAQSMADQRVTMMKYNAQSADEINQLRKALYASLTDEQKATFDRQAVGPRFARGPAAGGQGFGPGYGPGHGPWGGGRGPGFGRGCIGMT
jgi:hypothetical protein